MIRTIVIPKNTDVHLSIPEDYVGRKIEVMYYPVDELVEEKALIKAPVKTMASFKGILTTEEADQLQDYVKKSREVPANFKRD